MFRYTNISFPGLGIDIDPIRQFSIGPLTIHLYGVVIAFGLVLATIYCMRRSKEFGLTEDHVLDGVLWITPFAILCARAYYCAFSWELYAPDPISVLYIWKGGIAIYGGVLGAIVGMIVFCRVKKISLGATLDLVLMGFLIGQAIGRWGNFFNREAFGAETDVFIKMGLLNSLTGQVTVMTMDAMQPPPKAIGEFHCIVSNPPYIPKADIDGLDVSVKNFEPYLALCGGEDGYDFYTAIIRHWKNALVDGGRLYFEVGIGQADTVLRMMRAEGFGELEIVPDLQGIPRVVYGTKMNNI